jgi:hypothetical protein
LLKLIEIFRETLFRIEQQVIEGRNTAGALKGHFNKATENITKSQSTIKDYIKDASQGIHLDMERLLGICIGLAVGVDRLDKRQIHLQRQLLYSQNLSCRQEKSLIAIERRASSLQIYARKTCTLVGQLLHL